MVFMFLLLCALTAACMLLQLPNYYGKFSNDNIKIFQKELIMYKM